MKNHNWTYFWAGFGFHAAYICFIQDWMGKEKYIEYVNTFWIDIHWGVWIFLVCILFFVIFVSKKLETDNEKRQKQRMRLANELIINIEQAIERSIK